MPVEIRELIIRTEIVSPGQNRIHGRNTQELNALKRELMDACKRLITQANKKSLNKR